MKKPNPQIADALGHEIADKRLDILRRIGDVGSISEAARGAGVSYKAAWQAIDTLSNLAGTPLLERTVGGSGGGGATLTPAGTQLLQAAKLLSQARLQVLSQLSQGQGNSVGAVPRVNALGLRTSMRNQLRCWVAAIKTQGQAAALVHNQGKRRVTCTSPGPRSVGALQSDGSDRGGLRRRNKAAKPAHWYYPTSVTLH